MSEISNPRDLKTNNMDMMKIIANSEHSLDDIKNLTSSKVTDQLKVFLIAQARNELQRVIKLTQFLDRLESKFMNKVNSEMDADALTLRQYSDIISTITDLLSRSNGIISMVLKDDSLTTILNTTIYTSGSSTTVSTAVSSLRDAQSRERVRSVVQNILFATENYGVVDPVVEVKDEGDT